MDSELITGLGGILAGTIGYYIVNRYLEKKRESLSTKRDQLQGVYWSTRSLNENEQKGV